MSSKTSPLLQDKSKSREQAFRSPEKAERFHEIDLESPPVNVPKRSSPYSPTYFSYSLEKKEPKQKPHKQIFQDLQDIENRINCQSLSTQNDTLFEAQEEQEEEKSCGTYAVDESGLKQQTKPMEFDDDLLWRSSSSDKNFFSDYNLPSLEDQESQTAQFLYEVGEAKMVNYNCLQMGTSQLYLDQGKYSGEKNMLQERHGKGKCTYVDGSVYEGYWNKNLKEGYGELTRPNGYKYVGFWKEDLKHGKGLVVTPEREKIKARWEYDRLNGSGTYQSASAPNDKLKAFWHQDIMILDSNQNPDMYDRYFTNMALCLSVLFLTFVGVYFSQVELYLLIPAALIYFGQVFEGLTSSSMHYLSRLKGVDEMEDLLEAMKKTPPEVTFQVQNYHFDTKLRKTNVQERGKWVVKKEHYAQRVDSTLTSGPCHFTQWTDLSPDFGDLEYFMEQEHMKSLLFNGGKSALIRFHFHEAVDFSSKGHQAVEQEKKRFLKKHARDKYYDFSSHHQMPPGSIHKDMLVHTSDLGDKQRIPWFGSRRVYLVLTLLMMGWVQRVQLMKNSLRVELVIQKMILK